MDDETGPAPDAAGWAPELEELRRRRAAAEAMGGEEAVARQHALGKLDARERVAALLDPGTFREMGRLTGKGAYAEDGTLKGFVPSNAIIGTGRIDGRKVSVSADDFTIRGGSSESTISEKWIYAERLAFEMRMPLVRLVDTAGGSVKLLDQQQSTKIPGYPTWPVVPLLSAVPVVGVALGACAGLGAMKVLASHFSVMVRNTSQVFAAGPPVVKQAYGVDIDKNDLGGYRVHSRRSGIVHNDAADEREALAQVRRFLGYLPRHAWEAPPRIAATDDPGRSEAWLRDAIPRDRRKTYDPRKILDAVLDQGSIFEIGRHHGGSIITCLARLAGIPVGVMASDPRVAAGAMTAIAANKVERFIELCDTFHLPIVNLVDQPGNMTGLEAELAGTLLGALRVLKATERSGVPWVSVILRRAFGLAGGLHGRKHGTDGRSINHRFAWPSARWGSIPIEGGVAAAYRRDIAAAPDPAGRRAELEEHYNRLASPFRTAERFGIVDVIDPAETRALLCDWAEDAWEVVVAGVAGRPPLSPR
ncbi:acyl-CoA carboxylase subunit beta [Falsiroseomonas sp. CW058]|uniref:acyl-CoA carboxylase subunit beta n=1 Tax=Falsiroseomonas sp. CW058 TaxID=3388664 RepID=UPI003D31EF45